MDQTEVNEDVELEADPAAEAFGRLERELALMRRAVEHLAAERADIVIPDYDPTLVKMTANLASLDKCLREIEEKPALLETPEDFGQRIAAAARSARANDEEIIRQWEKATDRLETKLINALGSAATPGDQQQRERWITDRPALSPDLANISEAYGRPPSIRTSSPVTCLESSDTRKWA